MARKKNPNPRKTFKYMRLLINIALDHSYCQTVIKHLRPKDKIRIHKCYCETNNQKVLQPRKPNPPRKPADNGCVLTHSTQKNIPPKDMIWWKYAREVCKMMDNWISVTNHGETHILTKNCKVTVLRKELIKLMAVVMFSPEQWGNRTKIKGIFQPAMKKQYRWKRTVPFLPINSGKKRAHLGDLVKMKNYLLDRFQSEILPHLDFKTQKVDPKLPDVLC